MSQQTRISRNNTTIRMEGDDIIVTLHSTDVVRVNVAHVILNSGGWKTATTRTRINQAARQLGFGYSVTQIRGVWYTNGVAWQGRAITIDRATGKVTQREEV